MRRLVHSQWKVVIPLCRIIVLTLYAAFVSSLACFGSSDGAIIAGVLGYIAGLNIIVLPSACHFQMSE